MTAEPAPSARVPLRQLSELTGLSPVLIRAWERRYGFPGPAQRTAGGHRRYTQEEVDMVRRAALLVRSGLRAADAIAAAREGTPAPAPVVDVSAARLTELMVGADPVRALDLLRGATLATGFEATLEDIALPALRGIGELWSTGAVSVAEEHVATGIVMSWLGAVRAAEGSLPPGPPAVLLLTPEGEEHAVSVWALELLLRRRGVAVRALGASVPLPDAVQEATREGVRGVVFAISRAALRRQVARYADALHEANPSLSLFVGGAGMGTRINGVEPLPGRLTAASDELVAAFRDA